jgi:uncharacterized membrane protein
MAMRSVLIACCIFLAENFSAAADALPDPSARYRVIGVAVGDMLNVRVQPNTGAPVVATLQPEATGIVVTGVRELIGDSIWWELAQASARGATGWVNARFLARDESAAEPDANFALRCGGTEPFWSLEIGNGRALMSTPEGERPSWTASRWQNARGLRSGFRFVVPLERGGAPEKGWAALSRAGQSCSDGMSDREFPYDTILMTPDGEVLAGCCARAR